MDVIVEELIVIEMSTYSFDEMIFISLFVSHWPPYHSSASSIISHLISKGDLIDSLESGTHAPNDCVCECVCVGRMC